MLKIISVVGARPQFIKSACVSRAIREFNRSRRAHTGSKIKEIIVHTGQHYDYYMNDIFFKELQLSPPDYNLRVGSRGHGKQTAMMLEGMEIVLRKEAPDLVLVYGDTNSTLAGALAAKKLHILLAHVEAGLRSYNRDMPEEINRIVADRISDILFCPTRVAVENLRREGIDNSSTRRFPKVFLVGDVMYDSILFYLDIAKRRSDILERLALGPKGYYLATIHRAENTDNHKRLKLLLQSLNDIATDRTPVVFPLHPRTKKAMGSLKVKFPSEFLRVIEPVSYLDMLMLEKNAKAVLTDSGGIQKEAYLLRVPSIILRDETEWTEAVESGWNILAGVDKGEIKKAADNLSRRYVSHPRLYGDGKAGEKIVRILERTI